MQILMLHPVEMNSHIFNSLLLCDFRCTVQECSGTLMWPLSWSWPLKMTDCQCSRCGTFALPHHLLKYWRTIQGEFCLYPGARLTLSSCLVVLKTIGSFAGIQTQERYTILITAHVSGILQLFGKPLSY